MRTLPDWLIPSPFLRHTFQVGVALLLLGGVIELGQSSLRLYSVKSFTVGKGRDEFRTFPPEIDLSGLIVNRTIDALALLRGKINTLIAIPESAAFNYHLGMPDPIAAVEFHPGGLNFLGREQVLDELCKHPPDAIVLFCADLREYGSICFGADDNSGRNILLWIAKNYHSVATAGQSAFNPTGHAIDILIRNWRLCQSWIDGGSRTKGERSFRLGEKSLCKRVENYA